MFERWLQDHPYANISEIGGHIETEGRWRSNLSTADFVRLLVDDNRLLVASPRVVKKGWRPDELIRQNVFERILNTLNAKYVEVTEQRPLNLNGKTFQYNK